jgi:hypothetical protein
MDFKFETRKYFFQFEFELENYWRFEKKSKIWALP